MNYQDQLMKFLTHPENFRFLLEIEPLIEQAKGYWYKQFIDLFIDNIEVPKDWDGYSFFCRDDDLLLVDDRYKEDYFVHYAFYVGRRNEAYYGIVGPKNIDKQLPEMINLKNKLDNIDSVRPWKHYLTYTDFSMKRERLLKFSHPQAENAVFQSWMEEFWRFVENTWEKVEALNKSLHNNK